MTDNVQVSANEVKFLIKRSLEGMGFNPGEQLEAGKRAATSLQYGLVTSDELAIGLSHLDSAVNRPSLISQDKAADSGKDVWHFDTHNQCAIVQAELAVGLTLAQGMALNIPEVRLRNTTGGAFLAATLHGWLRQGLAKSPVQQNVILRYHGQDYWSEQDAVPRALVISATGVFQSLYHDVASDLASDEVRICFDGKVGNMELVASEATLEDQLLTSLDAGILLDRTLLERLNTLVFASFVPESAASLAGAGPG